MGLVEKNLIHRAWRFRLTDRGRKFAERFEPIVDEINQLASTVLPNCRTKMSWLLTSIGDFRSAKAVAEHASVEIERVLDQAAQFQIQERANFLKANCASHDETTRKLGLAALVTLGRQFAEEEVVRNLESQPPGPSHFLSLEILDTWKRPDYALILGAALKRFVPRSNILSSAIRKWNPEKGDTERPRNGLLVAISKRILGFYTPQTIEPATRTLIQDILNMDLKASDSEAGFLLYLLSPPAGLTKIRANLKNRVPIAREEAALFLAMIPTDEALNTLIEFAEGPPEQGGHEAACALSLLTDSRAQQATAIWSQRNDGYEDANGDDLEINGRKIKTWKMNEILRAEMRQFMREWAKDLHHNFAPLISIWCV